jgi:hypothetical protein
VTKAVGLLVIVILVVVIVIIVAIVIIVVVIVIVVVIITVVIIVVLRIGRPARRCIHGCGCRNCWSDHGSRCWGDNGSRGSNLSVFRSCRFCGERFAYWCRTFQSGGCDADAWGLWAVLLEENVARVE